MKPFFFTYPLPASLTAVLPSYSSPSQVPRCLILHLKRFKYVESQGKMRKLMYRVVFPLELKLSNTTADAEGADSPFALAGVVVHVGSGPTHGE